MSPDEFNELYPIGTPVVAYPGARPEDDRHARRIETRTRTEAWSAYGNPVVMVEGHGAWISLTHIDAIPDDDADEPLSMREETLMEDGYLRRSA